MTNKVHENENYAIVVQGTEPEYAVYNLRTGVVELTTKMLPEAINQAEHSNAYLINRMWEWIGKQAASYTDPVESLDSLN
jgi:hypothetical protein